MIIIKLLNRFRFWIKRKRDIAHDLKLDKALNKELEDILNGKPRGYCHTYSQNYYDNPHEREKSTLETMKDFAAKGLINKMHFKK